MPGSTRTLSVFLSSPGDVPEERRLALEVIAHLDSTLAQALGFHLECICWEGMVPDAGDPQDVIDLQTPPFDIFLGILWARFGSPTKMGRSGTEHEYLSALERRRRSSVGPRILLFFREQDVPFPKSLEEVEQLSKVVHFRQQIEKNRDCLYARYLDPGQFERMLRDQLIKYLLEHPDARLMRSVPVRAPEVEAAKAQLMAKLRRLHWIAYAPVDFDPSRGIYPDEDSLQADLRALASGPFAGLITFGSEKSLSLVPRLAATVGLQGMIMGIWNPLSREEIDAAVAAREYVDGYCVGHMGCDVRYSADELVRTITEVRDRTARPVTTTEPLSACIGQEKIWRTGDWLFPDVHDYWHEGATPEDAAGALFKQLQEIARLRTQSLTCPVVFKMISFPSDGAASLSQETQRQFFTRVLRRIRDDPGLSAVAFTFFAAFDNVWKTPAANWSTAEMYTGLYDIDRRPKVAVQALNSHWGTSAT